MSAGLVTRVKTLTAQVEVAREESRDLRDKVDGLEEMVKDLMANLEMQQKIRETGEGVGGDVALVPQRTPRTRNRGGRK
jgi:hypothetical protein